MSAEIHDIRSRKSRAETEYSSLQFKLGIYQRINREWAHELGPHESRVLFAIVDRTIGWGDKEAWFSATRLLNGDKVCGPLNMSRRTLYRALASLEAKGFINRRHPADTPDKTYYSVLIERMRINSESRGKRLGNGAARREEGPVPQRHAPVSDRHTPVPQGHSIYSNHLTDNQDTGNHCAALPDREPFIPAKIIRERSEKAVSSRAKAKLARREQPTSRNFAAEVEAAWREALRETFPDAIEPVWTGREKAQAKRLAKGWISGKQISFLDFTNWSVRNWTAIIRNQFKWMTKSPPPAVPAFSFYVALIDQFTECWAEGRLEEWLADKDRTELERLMARGMTFEQASVEMGKKNAIGALRDEMRAREIKVRARSRAAAAKLKRAEALADFGGKAPVHPRSITAQEMRAKAHPGDVAAVPASEQPDETMPPLSAPMVDPTQNPFD